MSFLKKLFGSEEPDPFMEHPTGKFKSAVDAMEDAVSRLRKRPTWDKWIEFSGQGEGAEPESYEFFEIKMLGGKIDVGDSSLDVPGIIKAAGTGPTSLVADGPHYSVAAASSQEVAQIMDAIFRHHFGLKPFADEGGDYAVGAEW